MFEITTAPRIDEIHTKLLTGDASFLVRYFGGGGFGALYETSFQRGHTVAKMIPIDSNLQFGILPDDSPDPLPNPEGWRRERPPENTTKGFFGNRRVHMLPSVVYDDGIVNTGREIIDMRDHLQLFQLYGSLVEREVSLLLQHKATPGIAWHLPRLLDAYFVHVERNHTYAMLFYERFPSFSLLNLQYAPQGDRRSTLSEEHAAKLMLDIALVLKHCHKYGVVHNDIHPRNINYWPFASVSLMHRQPVVGATLYDFGCATFAEDTPLEGVLRLVTSDSKMNAAVRDGFVNNSRYHSPENTGGQASFKSESDWYSFGLLLTDFFTNAFDQLDEPPICRDEALRRLQERSIQAEFVGGIDFLLREDPNERSLEPIVEASQKILRNAGAQI